MSYTRLHLLSVVNFSRFKFCELLTMHKNNENKTVAKIKDFILVHSDPYLMKLYHAETVSHLHYCMSTKPGFYKSIFSAIECSFLFEVIFCHLLLQINNLR